MPTLLFVTLFSSTHQGPGQKERGPFFVLLSGQGLLNSIIFFPLWIDFVLQDSHSAVLTCHDQKTSHQPMSL